MAAEVAATVGAAAVAEAVTEAKAGDANAALAAAVAAVTLPPQTPRPDFPVPAPHVGIPASMGVEAQADPDPRIPLSVCIRCRLDDWRRIWASPWVIGTLTQGFYLPWTRTPPRSRSEGYSVAPSDQEYLEKEKSRGMMRGFYSELTTEEAAQAHSILCALVVTSEGKHRMAIDYRLPNTYLADKQFKYEYLFDLGPQLRPGDALLS